MPAAPPINIARSEASKLKWQNPEYRRKISEKVKTTILKKSQEELTRIGKIGAEATKRKWTDQIFRQKMTSKVCSPETRIKLSKSAKRNWSNKQYREVLCESISKAAIKSLNDPEKKIRENRSKIAKSNWRNDEYRQKMLPLMPKIALKKCFNLNNVNEKIISANEAELFISKYHYAGRIGRSGINLGYYLDNNLIAVIIYNYPMRQETAQKQGYDYKEVLELSRLAIHPQYQVKNLASSIIGKSIKHIKANQQNIKCLISFADYTYNHLGIIYKASNWKLDGIVQPDYWYVDCDGYVCHKKTLWNKANGLKMTENAYCIKYKYSKIFGKEKFRYIFKLKE